MVQGLDGDNKEKQTMKRLLTMLAGILIATGATAGSKPLQVSLTPEHALCSRSEKIEGLCLNVWGENQQTAIALGIVNGSTRESAGLSWAVILNYADSYTGIQWGPINYTKGIMLGWQGGLINYTGGSMKGLQSGTINYAGRLTGLQFGLINYAEKAETGVQIGLVNLMPRNEWFDRLPDELAPGMIFINWRF